MGRAADRHSSITASHTSTANSTSVLLKLSGEYWKLHSVPGLRAACSRTQRAPCTAMALTPSRPLLNT
ncbi:hypothetical protein D3C76_1608030 [compost metagenome]